MIEAFLIALAPCSWRSWATRASHGADLRRTLSAWVVLLGVSVATLIVHAGSVLLGLTIAAAIPTQAIQLAAGIAFFAFAAWTIRGDSLDEDEETRAPGRAAGRWSRSAPPSSSRSWATRRCS